MHHFSAYQGWWSQRCNSRCLDPVRCRWRRCGKCRMPSAVGFPRLHAAQRRCRVRYRRRGAGPVVGVRHLGSDALRTGRSPASTRVVRAFSPARSGLSGNRGNLVSTLGSLGTQSWERWRAPISARVSSSAADRREDQGVAAGASTTPRSHRSPWSTCGCRRGARRPEFSASVFKEAAPTTASADTRR